MVRASDEDTESSTEAQMKLLTAFADGMGMIYVGKIVRNNLTGSLPGKREADFAALIDRKKTKNDFDIVLVQRLDRLTRSGSDHGFWFEHECRRAGIRVLFVGDDIPSGCTQTGHPRRTLCRATHRD